MGEGIRKVNEYIMKAGRTLVITDTTVPIASLPNGTIQVDPTTGSIKVKKLNGVAWENLDVNSLFAAKSVVNSMLGDRAVTTDKIALDGVLGVNIKDAEITANKLASGSVTELKMATDSVNTAAIKAKNVTTAKIADAAVTNLQLGDAAVDANKLASNAVTTIKILDANVTYAKLDTAMRAKMDAVGVIGDGTIAYVKLDTALKSRIDTKSMITISATAPVAPVTNDFWLDTSL